MTGGPTAEILPALRAMRAEIHDIGAFGAGMTAKVLNNMLAASYTAMTRLVLDWADAQGVDETKLLALINTASSQNWPASGFEEIDFARDDYAPDNSIGILFKDVAAALDIAPQRCNDPSRRSPNCNPWSQTTVQSVKCVLTHHTCGTV
jgi:3-hydroxyisobutyrate dehydrogenase-like beta-hydroxyacid dehydrogenase